MAQEVVPKGAIPQGKWGSGLVQDKAWGRVALPAVAVGVLAVSASAIFIRLADAPAIAIAFWRCALGAHFGFWISSLDYTSVAASVVLVSTQPVFVAVLAYLLFGERTTPLSFLGIVVAIAGTALIAFDRTVGSAAVDGSDAEEVI